MAGLLELNDLCAPPPLGPDIHPNAAGYGAIAQAFLATLASASRKAA